MMSAVAPAVTGAGRRIRVTGPRAGLPITDGTDPAEEPVSCRPRDDSGGLRIGSTPWLTARILPAGAIWRGIETGSLLAGYRS
jgi:hypothetical protein